MKSLFLITISMAVTSASTVAYVSCDESPSPVSHDSTACQGFSSNDNPAHYSYGITFASAQSGYGVINVKASSSIGGVGSIQPVAIAQAVWSQYATFTGGSGQGVAVFNTSAGGSAIPNYNLSSFYQTRVTFTFGNPVQLFAFADVVGDDSEADYNITIGQWTVQDMAGNILASYGSLQQSEYATYNVTAGINSIASVGATDCSPEVPEPGTFAMIGLGLIGLGWIGLVWIGLKNR